MNDETIEVLTKAIWSAEAAFKRGGGCLADCVRDYLVPEIEAKGLRLVSATALAQIKDVLEKAEQRSYRLPTHAYVTEALDALGKLK